MFGARVMVGWGFGDGVLLRVVYGMILYFIYCAEFRCVGSSYGVVSVVGP